MDFHQYGDVKAHDLVNMTIAFCKVRRVPCSDGDVGTIRSEKIED